MKPLKKIVIIGGTGFIGNNLTDLLAKRDDISLLVIYKNTSPEKTSPNVRYYQIDGAKEAQRLAEILNNTYCLVLLNQPDIELIKNIIKYSPGIEKILYASTLLLYPDSDKKQTEISLTHPLTDYETEKLEEESLLLEYSRKQHNVLYITRLGNVYGDIKNRGIIQKIFFAIVNKEIFTINGDGQQKRDYIFVDDVSKALEYLIFSNDSNNVEIFNICNGKGYTIQELISTIETITGKTLLIKHGAPTIEKNVIIGENKKIIEFSNIRPAFNLLNGLKKTYKNYLKHLGSKASSI